MFQNIVLTASRARRAIVSALLVASAAGVILAAKKPTPVNITLKNLSGERVRLRDQRGKVVVLNFWATWCGPCREEMPMLVDASKTWTPKGVVFFGASLDDRKTRANVPAFVDKFHIPFQILVGAGPDELADLGLGDAVPDTVFLDRDGFIFARVEGEMHKEELEERLAWITGGRSGPAPQALVRHLAN